METTLDRFGRVVIPKGLRDELGLEPGAVLQIEQSGDKILLKPLDDDEPQVVVKKGVSVFSGAASGDIEGVIQAHRQSRLGEAGVWKRVPRPNENGKG